MFVLFENLFAELQRLSHCSKTHGIGDPTDHVKRAVSAIRKSGVSFNVWLSKEGTRQSRSGLEMTSLNRNEKLKVMNSLPECFDDLLPSNTAIPLKTLWRNFLKIYKQLSSEAPDLNMLETEPRAWIQDFLSFTTTLEGHQKSSVICMFLLIMFQIKSDAMAISEGLVAKVIDIIVVYHNYFDVYKH